MKILSLVLAVIFPVILEAQTGQISVRVTDFETGAMIPNAKVSAGFFTASGPGEGWGGGRPNRETGHTESNGICTLTGSGNGGGVGFSAGKDGYYGSTGHSLHFTNVTGLVRKKYQPWNPILDIVLKPVGKPIAMYAKNVPYQKISVRDKPVGYDLEAGDWVSPYGEGSVEDILFTFHAKPEKSVHTRYGTVKFYDQTLIASVSSDGDGFLPAPFNWREGGSALRLRTAPLEGYEAAVTNRMHVSEKLKKHSTIREDQNYFFRVRATKDENGEIVSALYGKIYGDFKFDQNGYLSFTYYLNPIPNDRNVEFDPDKNLFGGRDRFAP